MILDTALQEREAAGRPTGVGMIGASATGRVIALQLGTPVPGMHLVAVANRTIEHRARPFREAGITEWRHAMSPFEAENSIACGVPVLTDDPMVLIRCEGIDTLVEVTGTIAPAAGVVLEAFRHGKHVVPVNAEQERV